jgi:tryptophan-rich sensory protein
MAIAMGAPLVIGLLAALVNLHAQSVFAGFVKPPLTPPGWAFPLVWTVLLAMMGAGSYLLWRHRAYGKNERNLQWVALVLYVVQLVFVFVWPIMFFRMGWQMLSFVWLLGLWAMQLALVVLAYKVEIMAAALLAPALVWVSYLGYLNIAFAILN